MKKFFVVLLATLALSLTAALAEQRPTNDQYDLTVSSRTDVRGADGSVFGYRMEAISGSHEFFLGCLKEYPDCYPLTPNSGTFSFTYLDNSVIGAYPISNGFPDGSVAVITGDGTRVVLFYVNK